MDPAAGLIAAGLFATQRDYSKVYSDNGHYGLFYGGGGNLLAANVVLWFAIVAWVWRGRGRGREETKEEARKWAFEREIEKHETAGSSLPVRPSDVGGPSLLRGVTSCRGSPISSPTARAPSHVSRQ